MISSAIKIVSKVICLVLIVSFGMFVVDEATTASKNQSAVMGQKPVASVARDAHGRVDNPNQTQLRQKIDQANDALVGPAETVVIHTTGTPSPWIQRGVPFLLGILVFGLFLHMLADWLALPRSGGSAHVSPPQSGFTPGYR